MELHSFAIKNDIAPDTVVHAPKFCTLRGDQTGDQNFFPHPYFMYSAIV